jgi:hypothetical protein
MTISSTRAKGLSYVSERNHCIEIIAKLVIIINLVIEWYLVHLGIDFLTRTIIVAVLLLVYYRY